MIRTATSSRMFRHPAPPDRVEPLAAVILCGCDPLDRILGLFEIGPGPLPEQLDGFDLPAGLEHSTSWYSKLSSCFPTAARG